MTEHNEPADSVQAWLRKITEEAHNAALAGQECQASHCPPGPDGRCDWPRCAE